MKRTPKVQILRPKRQRVLRKPWGALQRPQYGRLQIEVLDEKEGEWPRVLINSLAHGKIRALIAAALPREVSWLSPITVGDDGTITVTDIFVPEQICNSCYTEVTDDGESALYSELLQAERQADIENLACWGHSHTTGAVFASGVDEKCTHDWWLENARATKKTYFLRLIANYWDDVFASLYRLDEARAYHHVPLSAEKTEKWTWYAWAQREVQKKVIPIPDPTVDLDDIYFY